MINNIKIIAEIGWNHLGDMQLAKKMIDIASKNGADICKFQSWKEENLKFGPWDNDGRREIYKKAQLTENQHYELKDHCELNNVDFLTSVFNLNDIDFLKKLKIDLIKIPSHEVYNLALIGDCLDAFDKVLISSGASNWYEIEKIKKNFKNHLNKIIMMHCVSSYPLSAENVNFNKMRELNKYFKEIGYSGHYSGIEDAKIAICLGAKYVEKHFTIDKSLPGRDNKFALDEKELLELNNFRDIFLKMNIDKGLDLQECEKDIYNNYRGRWSKN